MLNIKRHLSNCKIKLAINCAIGLTVIALLCAGIYTIGYIARQQSEEYHAKQAELNELNSKIAAAQEDIVRMQRETERLNTPQGVEDAARSKLGMVKPGEVVYVSDTPVPAAPEEPNKSESGSKTPPDGSDSSFVFRMLSSVIY